jgi:iron complex outermembrane receptor protein
LGVRRGKALTARLERSRRAWLIGFTALGALTGPLTAHAQAPAGEAGATAMDQVIVTGTRETGKIAAQSLNPISILSAPALQETGQTNLRDALMQLLPSINHQTQGTTVGALTDYINLRGLSPNETLTLVDGIRRHTTSNTQTDAGPFRGATPADIDLIPISMVDHVELLGDGASAQYGSDAVAGVVNLILKSSDHGGAITSESGADYLRDGLTEDVSADKGFKLGADGFLHIGMDYLYRSRTDRTGTDSRTDVRDSHWLGDPSTNRASVAGNAGYNLGGGVEAYGFFTYAHRDAQTFQIYRLPTILPAIYPNGFTPRLNIDENDYALTTGVRGDSFHGWAWDLSSTFGRDASNIGMTDSANTTLYAETGSTPTSFHLSSSSSGQWTTDGELKRTLAPGVYSFPIQLDLGAEFRLETYSQGSGSYASYAVGGSQAVPGVLPQSAVSVTRNVSAGYVDISTNLMAKWKVDLAGRFENYSDFGNAATGKLSTRYDFNDMFALRGTVNNSIRAPTLAEEYHTAMTVTTSGATGELAPDSAGAKVLGAPALKPERSLNFTAGFVLRPVANMQISLDAYQIDISGRILDGGTYSGAQALAAYAAIGRTLPLGTSPSAVSASYLTNAADTRTQGADLIMSYRKGLGGWGSVLLDASLNLNQSAITHIGVNAFGRTLLNTEQKGYLTTDAPKNVASIGGTWNVGRFLVVAHELRYEGLLDQMTFQTGPNAFSTSVFQPYYMKPSYITNLLVGYHVTDSLTASVGANNLFDAYPNKVPLLAQYYGQALYDRYAQQISFNGGYYFMRLTYAFH